MAGKKGRLGAQGSAQRERDISAIALRYIQHADPITGRTLVIDDLDGHIERALTELGAPAARWSRMSVGAHQGTCWPKDGPYARVFLRLPRNKPSLQLALHAAASVMEASGTLLVYGANDEGIKSADRHIQQAFGAVQKLDSRNHCRLFCARRPLKDDTQKHQLSGWRETIPAPHPALPREWVTYPGVFARGTLDAATELLLGALPPMQQETVLDFASGAGTIAALLAHASPTCTFHALEADALSMLATTQNAPHAITHLSDAWHHAPALRFDRIVSNPPIHRGKSEDFGVLRALLGKAPAYLVPGGELWFVVQRQVPVQGLMEGFGRVELAAQDARFHVWRAITRRS